RGRAAWGPSGGPCLAGRGLRDPPHRIPQHDDRLREVGRHLLDMVGALAGLLSVLVGIGGGIVVVPGMALLIADIDFRVIQVVSLAMIIPTSLSGAYVHARRGNVLWRSVVALSLPGCVGVLAGVALAHSMPSSWLKEIVFPVFLCLMVIRLGWMSRRQAERG
ncbi:MAG TPA: sulfite exporter TauE/SafE family protein, partial [Candidatus Latescibacteria bacterium]|nr:sulfite exporter TauE/SafE family protein [Candidatus Latescibacterota bacterium]